MKDKHSLERSAVACINRAMRNATMLNHLLVAQKEKFCPARMAKIRGMAESVARDTHEYNAYMNALLTE